MVDRKVRAPTLGPPTLEGANDGKGVYPQMASHSLQDMYRRPGFLLKRCHQVSMAIFLDECSEFNLTQSQYGCLRALEAA
jgi:hypothetical protein